MAEARKDRRLPVGAEALPGGGVHFRVWAPQRRRVDVVFENGPPPVLLTPEGNGYFSSEAASAGAGALYRFRLDDDPNLYPDPGLALPAQGPARPVAGDRPVGVSPGPIGGWRGRRPDGPGDL